MDALEALCHGFTLEEVVENIDNLPALYNGENERRKEKEENHWGVCRMEMK